MTVEVRKKTPLVSISCITFNHAAYIRECLDGFLMQKTDFAFEVLIHDDASTDGTTEIIKEYEEKYPDIIRPMYETENQWSKGRVGSVLFNFPRARGKYIALCEGDDFWTDPNKLQKQVDFMEKNTDYAVCFHPVNVFFEDGEESDSVFPTAKSGFTVKNLLRGNFIQTNSVLYRKQDYTNLVEGVMPADWYMHLFHAQFGKIGFIDHAMSSYRRHAGGIWWDTTRQGRDEIWKKHGVAHMVLYAELLRMYGDEATRKRIIDNHIEGTVSVLNRIDNSAKTNLVSSFVEEYPELRSFILLSLSRVTYKNHRQLEEKGDTIKKLEIDLEQTERTINNLEQEKEQILNSKAYKIGNKLAQVSRTIRGIK